jgi:hypothetical protein
MVLGGRERVVNASSRFTENLSGPVAGNARGGDNSVFGVAVQGIIIGKNVEPEWLGYVCDVSLG